MDDPGMRMFDLAPLIAALDPALLAPPAVHGRHDARISDLVYCRTDRRLYVVVGEGQLFSSGDGLRSLEEVPEICRCGGVIVPAGLQAIDFIVETVEGTVLAIGRDRFADERKAIGETAPTERGVVWRKERGAAAFSRQVIQTPAWSTSKSGNAAAGFFGAQRAPAVAFVPYTIDHAHLFLSLDDGRSWRRHDLSAYFLHHAHEIYLPWSAGNSRTARMWVTGGDDPSGQGSGLVCFPGLGADGELAAGQWAFRERSGFRLVGLAGNGKHVFVGNESLAGGVLKIHDNQESIAAGDFEYCVGKSRHDYHQFRSLLATFDGLLVTGTDSYRHTGDTVRADSGGYLYLSTNDGASAVEISLGGTWVTALAYDGEYVWIAVSASRENGPDVSVHALTVIRLRRPDPTVPLVPAYVAKPVLADSSAFYRSAGYKVHPQPVLGPGEATMRVDMSCWNSVAVDVESISAARLVVEGLAFATWSLEQDAWHDVAEIACAAGERQVTTLSPTAMANRHFRLRNAGDAPALLRSAVFIGRR